MIADVKPQKTKNKTGTFVLIKPEVVVVRVFVALGGTTSKLKNKRVQTACESSLAIH